LKPVVTPSKGSANDSGSDTSAAAVASDDDDVDAVTAALAGTVIEDSSTVIATADDSSSNDDAAVVQAAKAWRVVDIKVLKDVWVVCSSKECAPVQVQVDFLGPYSST
jgi:hypothetical protein